MLSLHQEDRYSSIVDALRNNRFFIVWDGFEIANSMLEAGGIYAFPEKDRQIFKQLLYELGCGETKILITSRSSGHTFTSDEYVLFPLQLMQDEYLWQYHNATVLRNGLNEEFLPTLRLLGLHEHYAYTVLIDDVLKQGNLDGIEHIDSCFTVLESIGLCHPLGSGAYELHPTLPSILARLYPATDTEKRFFTGILASLIDEYSPLQLHEQQFVFSLFGASFY